ncbi:Protein tilB [Orchesella cincta]|uniref:Protein tilB n=1 Tax=Orchesella cincta TaxID=48709 RepID=A0A1D2N0Q2_ORCCI|nr:Protein tilB [Orchesella cincta]
MGRITMQLLRKRSEHNEGEIHSLEELALHQEKLENIELIDKVCRNLKILLLQNNAISKIENVGRLKNLEYLNLALNSVEKIENLEGCESLKKLDLTLNFVAELTSVKSISGLPHLEQLYLVGNPCHDFPGYRDYVVGALPHLQSLDGREITRAERITASQNHEELEQFIIKLQEEYLSSQDRNGPENLDLSPKESSETVISEKQSVDDNEGDDDDSEFWTQKSANTPQVRKEMVRRIEKQEAKKNPKETKKVKPPRKLTNAEGKPLNINEAKVSFSLHDECERSQLVLDLAVPKFMCTTLIHADVQPFHVKVTMKGKIFQLVLPEEVKPDSSYAQRSQATGHLIVTMPKVYDTSTMVWQGKDAQSTEIVDLTNRINSAGDSAKRNKFAQAKSSVLTLKSKLSPKTSPRENTDSTTRNSVTPKERKGILKKNYEDKDQAKIVDLEEVPPLI